MAGPKFSPRDWAVDPGLFGRGRTIAWRDAESSAEKRELRTAQLQHMWALRIRNRLRANRTKLSMYAIATGAKYDRVSKVLRGAVLMRLEDLAAAEITLGHIVGDGQSVHAKAEQEGLELKETRPGNA